jgi:hypothetical protein
MRTQLRLTEVFGIADTVSTEAGETVDLFQALLSLELTSRFFMLDFLVEFSAHAADRHHGDWVTALRCAGIQRPSRRYAEPLSPDLVFPRRQGEAHHWMDGDPCRSIGKCPHGRRHPGLLDLRHGNHGGATSARHARA